MAVDPFFSSDRNHRATQSALASTEPISSVNKSHPSSTFLDLTKLTVAELAHLIHDATDELSYRFTTNQSQTKAKKRKKSKKKPHKYNKTKKTDQQSSTKKPYIKSIETVINDSLCHGPGYDEGTSLDVSLLETDDQIEDPHGTTIDTTNNNNNDENCPMFDGKLINDDLNIDVLGSDHECIDGGEKPPKKIDVSHDEEEKCTINSDDDDDRSSMMTCSSSDSNSSDDSTLSIPDRRDPMSNGNLNNAIRYQKKRPPLQQRSRNVPPNRKHRDPAANLYISNLFGWINESNLVDLFRKYGNIVSVKVVRDKMSGQSKCYGYVQFDNVRSANEAIMDGQMKRIILLNQMDQRTRTVNVKRFKKRVVQRC